MRKTLSAAAVAAAAMSGLVGIGGAAADPNSDAARDGACAFARAMTTYDYRNLDSYFGQLLALTTGDLHKHFADSRSTLSSVLTDGRAHSAPGTVVCSVQSSDGRTARVRVNDQQIITSAGTQGKPQTDSLTLLVTVQNVGGRWLASDVQHLQ